MYSRRPGLTLGFHGCDESIVHNILTGKATLNRSENTYDWLGHGAYFWEHSPERALEFATNLSQNPRQARNPIETPATLGAVLCLGHCLDLLEYTNLKLLREGFELFKTSQKAAIPENKGMSADGDLLLRELDCVVIESLHLLQETTPFDSVRGVFLEGKPVYPTAGFREKTHIQICVRNPNCIKVFFLPRALDGKFSHV